MSKAETPGGSWAGRLSGSLRATRLLAGDKLRNEGAVVLAYHDVGDDPSNKTDYYVSSDRFRAHLVWAMEWGLQFVGLQELSEALIQGENVDRLAAIAFDDSLVGVHHHAMPILLELGLPATVFTVSAALGEKPPWWEGAARAMTRDELLEMVAAGFSIGSHTRTHPSLPHLDRASSRHEIEDSRIELEDLIGASVELFAYPFGHYDSEIRALVAENGYRAAYSFLNGRIDVGLDPYRLPRLNMWQGQDRKRLAYHLARRAHSWPPHQLEVVVGE
jgi:peptidoglycan/xylan/chitin deacetylase (PgdA/CDA1 family)